MGFLSFIIGVFVGVVIGVFFMCLFHICGRASRIEERRMKEGTCAKG